VTVIEQTRPAPSETGVAAPLGRGFGRLDPRAAAAAQANGALLVDIRRANTRRSEGEIPAALVVAGPLREWRLDRESPVRITEVGDELTVIVVGDSSQSSILVASALQGHGVTQATDVIGGFPAWRALGLPVSEGFTPAGRYVDDLPVSCG
jgi:rhodanese-related sulfurtransferase